MSNQTRIKISQVLEAQIPDFVNDEFPLFKEFLTQYFESLESDGGAYNLLQNIDKYIDLDTQLLTPESTESLENFFIGDDTLVVESTEGFPTSYGLLKIGDEIVTYKSKTETEFLDCVRGFSGVSDYDSSLVFSKTGPQNHYRGVVTNLSSVLLKEFFRKLKSQIAPGFEDIDLDQSVDKRLFYKQTRDFYKAKGSDKSFEILFGALYGTKVEVIRPSDYVFEPSASGTRRTLDIVLSTFDDSIDYTDIILNRTLLQKNRDSTSNADTVSAFASITHVERFFKGNKFYYLVSLDNDTSRDISSSGTVFGKFQTTQTTRLTESHTQNLDGTFNDYLFVDSTVAFEENDILDVYLDTGILEIDYNGKSINEFYSVNDANFTIPRGTLVSTKKYAYVELEEDNVYFRVTNVISDITFPEGGNFKEGDVIKYDSLGLQNKSTKLDNWRFNTAPKYNIESISVLSEAEQKYQIKFAETFNLQLNDIFFLITSSEETYNVSVSSREGETSYVITSETAIPDFNATGRTSLSLKTYPKKFFIERKLNKAKFRFFPEASSFLSDVQNTYKSRTLQDNCFVMSSSLPNYSNEILPTNLKKVIFTINVADDAVNDTVNVGQDASPTQSEITHPFYTGDAIVYLEPLEDEETGEVNTNRLNIDNGKYYVTVLNSKNIKLSRSLSDLYNKIYVNITGNVTDNTFFYVDYFDIQKILDEDNPFKLSSKRCVKLLTEPIDDTFREETVPGKTGMLNNGVEILNYKSKTNLSYGPITKINVSNSGNGDYDVINPPLLSIFDGNNADGVNNGGIGATGHFNLFGSVRDILVVSGGFNYETKPLIRVYGGNGTLCNVEPIMETYRHNVRIESEDGEMVGISSNLLTADEDHFFKTGEPVIYRSIGDEPIVGLEDLQTYFISVVDDRSFRLHSSGEDAVAFENPVNITDFGVGYSIVESVNDRQKLARITIIKSSEDFSNRKVLFNAEKSPNSVDFYENTINIKNHGFQSGELITYESTDTPITGLTSAAYYYVTKIDDDSFKLSESDVVDGVDGLLEYGGKLFYESDEFVNLFAFDEGLDESGIGVGDHIFRYPDIQVAIQESEDTISIPPTVIPVVRGFIDDVFLTDAGVGYGATNIFNYKRLPVITAEPGKLASIKPYIVDGEIKQIIIQNAGQGYVSQPYIGIDSEEGFGADLIPIIKDGRLDSVVVKSGGFNYTDDTILTVNPAGKGAKFESEIFSWVVNEVSRSFASNQIYSDDGFIYQDSLVSELDAEDYGILQYTVTYIPRKFRETIYNESTVDGRKIFNPDLIKDSLGRETESKNHSPLIGWAYDGNPIYGPYGFASADGTGGVKRMISGYKKRSLANRPSLLIYPLGFFCNDYEWTTDGDLDESNGRFCITPDYPNGVYAYFATIGENLVDYDNFKEPVFPYFIGNSFKSPPIEFNFEPDINQESFTSPSNILEEKLSDSDFLRNVRPYNLSSSNGSYEYLFQPSQLSPLQSIIDNTAVGKLNDLNILSGGKDYKVGDRIVFSANDSERRPLAEVTGIANTEVTNISVATSAISNVEFLQNYGSKDAVTYIGFTTSPHNMTSGLAKIYDSVRNVEFVSDIKVKPSELSLGIGIGTTGQTGIVTYISIFGSKLSKMSNFRENDIYTIESDGYREEIKILNIEEDLNRIRVERNANGTIGTSYSKGQRLFENPRKFLVPAVDDANLESSEINEEYYFNPIESVGVGIGTTVAIENPGTGSTSRFIARNRIYIGSHDIQVNDEIRYDFDESPISVSTGSDQFTLERDREYFAFPFNNNVIGLSTNRIGVGSTGSAVGFGTTTAAALLTFTDFGSGVNHSLRTRKPEVLTGEVIRYESTITSKNNHNLKVTDRISVDCRPTTDKIVDIVYNQTHRKFSAGTLAFDAVGINTIANTITIPNHNLKNEQVVIFSSNEVAQELEFDALYVVVVLDSNTIQLIDKERVFTRLQDLGDLKALAVDLLEQKPGKLLPINPPLLLQKNQTLIFDVSNASLSYSRNNILYPAFAVEFYTDIELKNKFVSSKQPNKFNVISTGVIGVDDNATVRLVYDDDLPETLYYNLVPLKNNQIPADFSLIKLDNDIITEISIEDSSFSGNYDVKSTTDKTFSYFLPDYTHDENSFTSSNAIISYLSSSDQVSGPIGRVRYISDGNNITQIPQIEEIVTESGVGAILQATSKVIGNIKNINISDIGFDFPTDFTLAPRAHTPTLVKVEELVSIVSIGVTFPGKNYTSLPDLKIVDGISEKVVDDIVLDYVFDNRFKVRILKNTGNINNVKPSIIPFNNTNGYKIRTLTYDPSTKDATIVLDTVGFSTLSAWPFAVGEKFLLEGVNTLDDSLVAGTGDLGYNNENYEFKLYEVKTSDPNIGGQVPGFTFNMEEFVGDGDPGIFDDEFTTARVVPQQFFPQFQVEVEQNVFFDNEDITNGSNVDKSLGFDSNTSILRISTNRPEEYKVGQLITGKSSRSQANITEIVGVTTFTYNIKPRSKNNKKGFLKKGFLNEDSQRLHDSDYYQYFSYSLKSNVGISSWNDPVESMVHPVGMKKFSDLQVVSEPTNSEMIEDQNDGALTGISHINSILDLNCYTDIDLVTENNVNNVYSDEIRFNSLILQDFFKSVGNRVLLVDDFSDEFNSNPRATSFSTIDSFSLNAFRFKKYFLLTTDTKFPGERQVIIVNMLHNNIYGFVSQYGRVETDEIHGYFDIGVFENNGLLLFYPLEPRFDDYAVTGFKYAISPGSVGISTQYIGDIASVGVQTASIPSGTTSAYKIVGIESSYSSSKVMVVLESTDLQYYQSDEINIVHDGTNIIQTEFSTLATDTLDEDVSDGIGTYRFGYNGNEIEMDFVPNSGLTTAYNVNATVVSISNTSRVATGTSTYQTTLTSVGLGTTSAGTATTSIQVMEIDSQYRGFNVYASIEDMTNNDVQFSELTIVHDNTDVSLSEFGRVVTDDNLFDTGIGTFTAFVDPVSKKTQIHFEAIGGIPNKQIEVRLLVNSLSAVDLGISTVRLGFQGGEFSTMHGGYTGSQNDIKRSFELKHKGDLIFERTFNSEALGTVVSVESNVLNLSNHFFVSGEEVTYTFPAGGQPIGIATTTLVGVGTTTHLPPTLFVIKQDSGSISFTDTAENALRFNPNITINITSAGIGTQHQITSTNKDAKGVFTIDNMMQSPIQRSDIITTLVEDISLEQTLINTAGITSIFSGDILKINDEFMLAETVGVGTQEKLRVRRPWLGSVLGVHTTGDTIIKMYGDYTISGSTINFTSPPFGKVPITVDVNQFGIPFVDPNDRDFTGITTNSSFQGRTFMRSGSIDTNAETYSRNYIFDDISTRFTGIRSEFPLTVDGANITGISTDNAIILVNDIFQQSSRSGIKPVVGNYTLAENSGETTITFNPQTLEPGEDINTTDLPIGGVIVSVGSTNGLGYQPCVPAGGTANVSGLGTISSVSIGNSGSGYRPGIQTHIGVKAVTSSSVDIIGSATALNGHITEVSISNDKVFYAPRDISDVIYSNTTGLTTVTTSTAHELLIGQEVLLSGIAMTCDYSGAGPVNITNVIYDNISGIMTVTTSGAHNLQTTGQRSDVIFTGIAMTCDLDGGASTHIYPRTTDPFYCGSRVTAVNSSTEFETNVGVSTVPTFYQSGGVVQPVIIAPRVSNNSASRIDPAADGTRITRIINSTSFEVNTGISTREHFYARCGEVNTPIEIVIDGPIGYTNIPLIYSDSSVQGIGTKASIDMFVSRDTSIAEFDFNNDGFAYGQGEKLTIAIGGTTGIPTTGSSFKEFAIDIERTHSDEFSAWSVGQFQQLDPFDSKFNGKRTVFPISFNGDRISIRAGAGSNIDVSSTIFIFINDILQVPGQSYQFRGGGLVVFDEPIPKDYTSRILFYKGTKDIDVVEVDIDEPVEPGDTLTINSENISLKEDTRTVEEILASDIVLTNPYRGRGRTNDESLERPVMLCKQTEDTFIYGFEETKDRESLEPNITPKTNIIQSVGIGTTTNFAWVESVKTFFDNSLENQTTQRLGVIEIISQEVTEPGFASARVSSAGIITEFSITNPGAGYTSDPQISIGSPGTGNTTAIASCSVTSGIITSITVTNSGTGYTNTNPPQVLIEPPVVEKELIEKVTYEGDFGSIVSISNTSVGVGTTALLLSLYIPFDSFLRNPVVNSGFATGGWSGIQTGHYFTCSNSNTVGTYVTALNHYGETLSISTSRMNVIFQAADIERKYQDIVGIGSTQVLEVTVYVEDEIDLGDALASFDSSSLTFDDVRTNSFDQTIFDKTNYYGDFSWGKVTWDPLRSRRNATPFTAYHLSGYAGISTSPVVKRVHPLRTKLYTKYQD